MADNDTTQLAAVIPEHWDLDIAQARYEDSKVYKRVLNKSAIVKEYGDIINMTYEGSALIDNVTPATGAFTPAARSYTNVQLTIDKWKHVSEKLIDNAAKQSFFDPKSNFPKAAGKKIGEQVDLDLLALLDNANVKQLGNQANPKVFDRGLFTSAYFIARTRKLPLDGLTWYLTPEAWTFGIWADGQLTKANEAGLGKNALITAQQFDLMSIPVVESVLNKVKGKAVLNGLCHKEALAAATQLNNKYEMTRLTPTGVLGDLFVMQTMYGVKLFRADHALVINVQAMTEDEVLAQGGQ